MLHWAWSGIGYVAALLFQPTSGQLFCITSIVFGTLVSGGNPPLDEMTQTSYGWFLSSISPQRWAQEALFLGTAAPVAQDLIIPGIVLISATAQA